MRQYYFREGYPVAHRVKQADGSYCYTDNCRIHDRLGSSTGLKAVLADAVEAQRKQYSNGIVQALTESSINVDEVTSRIIADRVLHNSMNAYVGYDAYTINEELNVMAQEAGVDRSKWNSLSASYGIYNSMLKNSIVHRGDEVVINKTGERAVLIEGSSAFGGALRVETEHSESRANYAWFMPKDVTKLVTDENSLARERILAAQRDLYIPVHIVKKMMREETNTRTRNAQAVREFTQFGDPVHSKMLMLDFCDDLALKYGEKGLTKRQLVAALTERVNTPYPGMGAALPEARKALKNILSYLDPKP